jgi:co-chaperonin GroES (HSP10)
MHHEEDPKDALLNSLGDMTGIELFHNQVLLAVYIRPQKTKSGLILTDSTTAEDRFQSKIGLLVKSGPQAFQQDGTWFTNLTFSEGYDWLLFRPSDGWSVTINGILCRIFDDINIKGRVPHPDSAY